MEGYLQSDGYEVYARLAKDVHAMMAGLTPVGKAVCYTLGQWDKLIRYLDIPELTPDNNRAENAIHPFVLGRKNWLFPGSPRGAMASCALYSLIETANQNSLNPYDYLNFIFTRIPNIAGDEEWEALLPQNLTQEQIQSARPS